MHQRAAQTLYNGLALGVRCARCCCPAFVSIIGLVVMVLLAVLMVSTESIYRVDFMAKETLSTTVTAGQLSNGLRWMISHNGYKPGVFSSYLCVQAGSVNEDDDILGIAHFVEHMVFDQTRDFSGRNGLMREITRAGSLFNAFTSFRTTCFQLWDMPAAELELGQNIHKNQVLYARPNQTYVDLEKGAVLGEARYRNGSDFIAMVDMLNNHGEGNWRIASRFPIGSPTLIKNFTATQVTDFIDKWYRLDRMRLIVVGDIDTSHVRSVVSRVWGGERLRGNQQGTPPPEPDLGTINHEPSFFNTEVLGINGVQLNLLITTPLESHPYTANMKRQHTLNTLFSIIYGLQVQAMLQYTYSWQGRDVQYGGRSAGVAVELDYSLGNMLRAFVVDSPGNAQTGTWRADWEMALTELRRLAIRGPPAALVVGVMYVVSNNLNNEKRLSSYIDTTTLIDMMLGDMDPAYVYESLAEDYATQSEFLGLGYVTAAQYHIQAEAQFMWKALIELATGAKYTDGEYGGIIEPVASLSVFTDVGNPAGSLITKEAVLAIVLHVQAASTPDSIESVLSGMLDLSPSEGVPASGHLIESTKLPNADKMPDLLDSYDKSGVQRYKLANGIIVNLKHSMSGADNSPAGPPGELLLQVVSLGGKATQTSRLTGACEFVNMHANAGNSVVYNDETVDYYEDTVTRYFGQTGVSANLVCGSEQMIISSRLSGACENYPKPVCGRDDVRSYYEALEAVRLAMNPLFDDTSTERAAEILDDVETTLSRTADPSDLLTMTVEPLLLHHTFPNDTRLTPVTSAILADLNPYDVQTWVREQFRADRIEVNVVGDANHDSLLRQLNQMLGSIPTPSTNEMIGYDIYNISAASSFSRSFPSGDAVALACDVTSVSPDRGFAVAYGTACDYYANANDTVHAQHTVGVLAAADTAASLWAMWNVRVLKGYGYFAMVSSQHSLLFPGYGYYRVQWAPGDYPTPLQPNDPLNLKESIQYVADYVYANMTSDIVQDALVQIQAQSRAKYVLNTYWLEVLRGISLKPPAWVLGRDYVKPITATDVIGTLNMVQSADLLPMMADGFVLSAALSTVPTSSPTSRPKLTCK